MNFSSLPDFQEPSVSAFLNITNKMVFVVLINFEDVNNWNCS